MNHQNVINIFHFAPYGIEQVNSLMLMHQAVYVCE